MSNTVVLASTFQFNSKPRDLPTIDDAHNTADETQRWGYVETSLSGHTTTPAFLAVPKRCVQRVVLRQCLCCAD